MDTKHDAIFEAEERQSIEAFSHFWYQLVKFLVYE